MTREGLTIWIWRWSEAEMQGGCIVSQLQHRLSDNDWSPVVADAVGNRSAPKYEVAEFY